MTKTMYDEKTLNTLDELHYVIESVWNGYEMVETVLYSGSFMDCSAYIYGLRKYDNITSGLYIRSESDIKKAEDNRAFYNTLTPEQKREVIVVDGRTYVKAIYERMRGGK